MRYLVGRAKTGSCVTRALCVLFCPNNMVILCRSSVCLTVAGVLQSTGMCSRGHSLVLMFLLNSQNVFFASNSKPCFYLNMCTRSIASLLLTLVGVLSIIQSPLNTIRAAAAVLF